jgi:hypothetical protein
LLKFQISKLNNYYTDMCWSCQGTMVFSKAYMVGNLLPPL